jgi:hypothetical protein
MKTAAVFAALVSSSAAFTSQNAGSASRSTALNAEMSKALPFLTQPPKLKGMVGDVGFDPLNFSESMDINWMREAEIKHGRASMLATLGFVSQQYLTLPGYEHVDDSNLAPSVVGASAMLQIVFWMGVLEFWTNKGNVTMETMFEDPNREPGNLGFDPMGLSVGKTEDEMNDMKLKEIKNGRLAMLAIGGMIHHNWITGEALF